MFAVFATAWRVILKRTHADWLILTAAALIVVLATTLLSAGPIYAGAVAVSGLHRTLHDAPVTDANLEITARIGGDEFRAFDDLVVAQAGNALRYTGARIDRSGRSDSFALPNQPGDTVTELGVFGFYEDIEQHAALVEGNWPQARGTPQITAAIPEATAQLLAVGVGDQLQMESRRDRGYILTVHIVGIYRITDSSDPYWWDDQLEIDGIQPGQSFTTYGPFVVHTVTFFGPVTTASAQVRWRMFPQWDNLTVSDVSPFRGSVEQLADRLNRGLGPNSKFAVNTSLPRILRDAERSLLVTRTGVMILTVQLAVLAGYALVLTAGLLIEQRRVETALLRSRGASSGQIGAMAFMEGALLAAPAALAGPWIAAFSLRLLNVVGPLTSINLAVDPVVNQTAYFLSSLAAIGCVAALTLPAFLLARSFVDARSSRGRQQPRGIAQRAGIDLALLAIAALAYWQLRRYGAPITASLHGRLGLDPFLVAAPALGLLAGAVVALRIIPLLARLIDRTVSSTKGLVPSLGAWQISRRPARYARSALLLVLAVAIGLFALSYTSTWTASQRDQADFQIGADLRVVPDRRLLTAIPAMTLADAHRKIDGVTTSVPVAREPLTVSRSAGGGRLLAIDAALATDVVAFRDDLSSQPLAALMGDLLVRRPALANIPMPDNTMRVAIDVLIRLDAVPAGDADQPDADLRPRVSLVLQDGRGMLHRRTSGLVEPNGETQRITFDLAHEIGDAEISMPDGPVSIVAIELRVFVPNEDSRSLQLDVLAIESSPTLAGDDWSPVPAISPDGWVLASGTVGGILDAPSIAPASGSAGEVLAVSIETGSVRSNTPVPIDFRLLPGASQGLEAIPVLVSHHFLEMTETAIGDRIQLQLAAPQISIEIVGAFEAFPTMEPAAGNMVVVDLPTLTMTRYHSESRILGAGEWWLAIDDTQRETIVETLWTAPYSSSRVFDRIDRAITLRTDPVALGIIGALSLGFVAAALFASIGFIASASVSARERLTEFALLRALGLSPWQLSGWLSLENGLLVVTSLVGGTLLGLTLAWLVMPFVTLTQDASAVVPGVIVTIPWRTVLLLEVITIVVLAAVVAVLAVLLRRIGLGSVLRLGEE